MFKRNLVPGTKLPNRRCGTVVYFRRITMRKVILAVCCVALIGGVSAASAQSTGQPGQDSMKTNSPMNAQNKMMKKKKMKKGMMKSGDDMSGMKKDDMGGMKK